MSPLTTTTPTRRAVLAAAGAALAAAPLAAHAAAPAGTRPAARPAPLLRDTHYLAATHTGSTARLLLVDRATGAVTRTVATAPMLPGGRTPFADARIARDGSVWYVRTDGTAYGRDLLHVVRGRPVVFLRHVGTFALSPDGRRVAVSVISPDTDHDGRGTTTVRVGTTDGRGFVTLARQTFPVTRQGLPAGEYLGPAVATWVGDRHVMLDRGHGGTGALSVVRADRATAASSWPTIVGDDSAVPVGVYADGSVLVAQGVVARGVARYDLLRVSAAHPRGTRVATVASSAHSVDDIRRVAAAQRVTVTAAAYARVRAPRGVVVDAVLLGR